MKTIAIILLVLLTIGCQKEELPASNPEEETINEPTSPENGGDENEPNGDDGSPDYSFRFEIFEQPEITVTTTYFAIDGENKTTTAVYTPNEGRRTVFTIEANDEIYQSVNITIEFTINQQTYIEHEFFYGERYLGRETGYSNWGKKVTQKLEH